MPSRASNPAQAAPNNRTGVHRQVEGFDNCRQGNGFVGILGSDSAAGQGKHHQANDSGCPRPNHDWLLMQKKGQEKEEGKKGAMRTQMNENECAKKRRVQLLFFFIYFSVENKKKRKEKNLQPTIAPHPFTLFAGLLKNSDAGGYTYPKNHKPEMGHHGSVEEMEVGVLKRKEKKK
jgi:hypothetical protein